MLTRSRLGLLHVNFGKFRTQLWSLVIVKISFPLNMLPVKEIMLHVKPVSTMCFMRGLFNKHCLLTFLVLTWSF